MLFGYIWKHFTFITGNFFSTNCKQFVHKHNYNIISNVIYNQLMLHALNCQHYRIETHQGPVMHICISKLHHHCLRKWFVSCLSANAGLMLIAPLETNLSDFFFIKISSFSVRKCIWSESFLQKGSPFCLSPSYVLCIYKWVLSYNCTCKELNTLPQSSDFHCLCYELLYL